MAGTLSIGKVDGVPAFLEFLVKRITTAALVFPLSYILVVILVWLKIGIEWHHKGEKHLDSR
ncbi:hypothetical protein [Syntrophomonas wolfei]|uniref:hypothetical protein n=1 Tax=Syntrophomonas wolfei TaxID=863 RepID=UPI000772F865|nr:hypothetical protein [Syntrophomonas wolfei]